VATDPPGSDARAQTASRLETLGPVAAGMLLDLVDFATYGPIGLWAGLLVGGAAGYLLAASMGVAAERRWGYALAAGVYCMLPFTAFLPVATLLGALIRLREKSPPAREAAPDPEPRAIEADYESRWERD
jgi:hypothetical protein